MACCAKMVASSSAVNGPRFTLGFSWLHQRNRHDLLDLPGKASAIAVQLPGPPSRSICLRNKSSSCVVEVKTKRVVTKSSVSLRLSSFPLKNQTNKQTNKSHNPSHSQGPNRQRNDNDSGWGPAPRAWTPPTSTPVATDSDVRHRASRRGNDDENSLLTLSRLHSRIAVRLPVVVVANVPRDVTPRARPSPPRVVTPAVCGFPSSTGGGSRARASSTACVKTKEMIACIRTSGVHALFTMRSSSMIDTFMRARVARCGSGGQTRGRRSLANDRRADVVDPLGVWVLPLHRLFVPSV